MGPLPEMEVAIRDYNPAPAVSTEATAFTATLVIDGGRAGRVSNPGYGENSYEFEDRDVERRFYAYARAWGREHQHTWVPEDELVAVLCQALELQRIARTLAIEKGAQAALLIEKGREQYLGATVYSETYLVPVMAGQDPGEVARDEGADRHRLVTP